MIPGKNGALSLDGANHNALDKMPLDEGVNKQNREGGHNNEGVLHQLRHQLQPHQLLHILDVLQLGGAEDQDDPEQQLQGPFLPGAQIDQTVEVNGRKDEIPFSSRSDHFFNMMAFFGYPVPDADL